MQGLSFCLQPHSPLQSPNYILHLPAVQDTFAVLTDRAHWKENSLEPNKPDFISQGCHAAVGSRPQFPDL